MMSTPIVPNPVLASFVQKLEKTIPCYGHARTQKDYVLKKCDTMIHLEMRHFATVHDVPTKKYFRIVSKELYADDWCRTQPTVKHKTNAFGGGQDGLEFYVNYVISERGYKLTLEILRRTMNNLPPCSL